jgi:hypothetical protein
LGEVTNEADGCKNSGENRGESEEGRGTSWKWSEKCKVGVAEPKSTSKNDEFGAKKKETC